MVISLLRMRHDAGVIARRTLPAAGVSVRDVKKPATYAVAVESVWPGEHHC